jgi:acyl-CoA thioester hydrolase
MDVFRHLNNGAIGRFLEEGRAALNMAVFGRECLTAPTDGQQMLFVSITCDFLRQAYYPGTMEIGTGVLRIGTSSYAFAQAAFQHGECCALAETVLVKAINGRSAPLSDEQQAALRAMSLRA